MKDWSTKRRISFGIHVIVVLIPFSFSTLSALSFWHNLFDSWLVAAPMVAIIDVLALLGLILYIARIESPFTVLRHALPFISIIPLGLELYGLLERNGAVIAGIVATVATAIFVVVAWQCFTTIERLFIPPIEAAREKARESMESVRVQLARLKEIESAADSFARERLNYHAPVTTITALSDESEQASISLSKTARVRALAADRGISVATAWRKVKAGEIVIDEGE